MISRSNDVARYFKSTKHKVAPKVHWFLCVMQSDGTRETTLGEIADFLNTNRHSVSRALGLLKKMGVVQYRRTRSGLLIEGVSTTL